jgi:hypothetical protein
MAFECPRVQHSAVSNIYYYFVAPNDELAAETIGWHGGPSAGSKAKGLFGKHLPGYRSILGRGVDPVVQLGVLEEMLTRVGFYAQLDDPLSRPMIAERDGGERLVLKIGDKFSAALASAEEVQLRDLALPWSEIEEFYGDASVEGLVTFLIELRDLVVEAKATHSYTYCWLSV